MFVSSVPTHPTTAGNRSRVAGLCEMMESLGCDFHLFVFAQEEADPVAMKSRWGRRRFTFCPKTCKARQPLWRRFRNRFFKTVAGEKFHPLDIDTYRSAEVGEAILRTAQLVKPDCVMVMYAFHSWILELFPGHVRKVILAEDVLTDRHQKFLDAGIKPEWFSTTEGQERKGLERANCVISIQEVETRFLRGICKTEVMTVGHLVRQEVLPNEPAGPLTVLFIGSNNGINRDAIRFCLDEVWPRLRQVLPDARLKVVGKICGEVPSAPEGVELCGTVPELRDAYAQAHLVLAPLRFGTGLKIKCMEALGYGKCLVTTPIGAEGLEEGAGSAFVVAKDAAGLAAACAGLLGDVEKRRVLSLAAGKFIAEWNSFYRNAFVTALTGASVENGAAPDAQSAFSGISVTTS